MNPVITFDDYTKIGMMETALSNHAEEAFSELSEEEQKIAEKIFKCLTETDRENREIRRATSVDKLCAVANADFSEAAAVIEVFRKEGRTFLMPPPDVKLNKNSLIDISHESLIRNWERLKKWVEEEGQSSQTYRRLAEDAFLHQKGKVGFWSEPELSDAIAWRTDFEPNETWAQLYKEKGERQYRASFAEAMQYLDDSKADRDAEIFEDEQQQNALRKYAKNLRWTVIGLVFVLLATVGAAAFAVYQMNEAVRIKEALVEEKKNTDDLNGKLQVEKQNTENAFNDLQSKTNELETKKEELSDSLDKQTEATEKAEEQKERADKEAEQAKLKEAEKQKALEGQQDANKAAQVATIAAQRGETAARESLARATASEGRAETNRNALTFLEQGENAQAKPLFEKLLVAYETEPMPDESRTDGVWWALHNLGIVNSRLGDFDKAHGYYIRAINTLNSANKGNTSQTFQSQSSGQYFIKASYDKRADEINRCLVTTFRRLAQLYRAQAQNAKTDSDEEIFNKRAVEAYGLLLDTLKKEPVDAKQPNYPADVWVELADTYYDLYVFDEAIKFYKDAEKVYAGKNDLIKQVEVLTKWAEVAAVPQKYNSVVISKEMYKDRAKEEREKRDNKETAVDLVERAIDIQENKMKLSVIDLKIAESYDQLAEAYQLTAEGDIWVYPPYDKIFEKTRKLNSTVYSTGLHSFSGGDIKELADAYANIGNCRRAEEVYLFAIGRANQQNAEGRDLRGSYTDLEFKVNLAELYRTVMRDQEKAQKYFDEFAAESEKERDAGFPIKGELILKAGDFYFAARDYQKADKFYQHSLQLIEKERLWAEDPDNQTIAAQKEEEAINITRTKAEVLVKAARVYEAQNKLAEAEAMYLQAVSTINAKFGENDIKSSEFLIHQADFYAERGNKKKAAEIYNKAETILSGVNKLPKEKLIQQIHIQKKLGDINRDNAQVAIAYYEKAFSGLESYEEIQGGETYRYFMGVAAEACAAKEVNRYTKDFNLTEEFWIDSVKTLEALVSLGGVKDTDSIQGKIEQAKEQIARLQESPCERK